LRDETGPLTPVGIIGLGAGAMACLGAPDEHWTFFEIDPAIIATARDPRYFHYLSACPIADVVLGDGRLEVAKAPPASYRVLVVDAFGSDAIPVHLLTREAMDLYFDRLKPGGVLLVHFSNRNIDLLPVLAALAADRGLAARWQFYRPATDALGQSPSQWAIFARQEKDLGALASDARWQNMPPVAGQRVWTDDYANIVSVIRW
jgi:spermidine synthase